MFVHNSLWKIDSEPRSLPGRLPTEQTLENMVVAGPSQRLLLYQRWRASRLASCSSFKRIYTVKLCARRACVCKTGGEEWR